MGDRNYGAYLLDRTGVSEEEIAKKCGVSQPAAHFWKTGEKKPRAAMRLILREHFSINLEAWDEAVPDPHTLGRGQSAVTAPIDGSDDVEGMILELKGMARSFLGNLRGDTGATPLEKAKVMSALAGTLSQLAKMTGDYDLGRRLLLTPQWKKLELRIVSALANHPVALAAVADALEAARSDERP